MKIISGISQKIDSRVATKECLMNLEKEALIKGAKNSNIDSLV